jgi:hypothetical protein
MTLIDMSCGLDVENLILIFGKVSAINFKSLSNEIEVFFCRFEAFEKSFFKPPPYHK